MSTLPHIDREVTNMDITVRLLLGAYTPELAEYRRALERQRQGLLDEYRGNGEPDGHLWEYARDYVHDGVVWNVYRCRACGETCERVLARVR